MYDSLKRTIQEKLAEIKDAGLYKEERVIVSPQGATIRAEDGREALNFCANNYLGLANDPRLVEAAKESLDRWGYGMSSVRFICGTQELHKALEAALSDFLGTEDTILFSSCFDANGGIFETLLGPEDAVLSDELNHASIIDGVRLCKATRFRYKNGDMDDLERCLKEASSARLRLVVTDGVFSMDGIIAPLDRICDLAERYDAAVMIDDSHAVGVLGEKGRGTHEYRGCMERVDIITGTLGKALGGASGGYVAARREIVELLRQRSRPYLFSNTLAPVITATSLKALDILKNSSELLDRLKANTLRFRSRMTDAGFEFPASDHPIVPIMIGDAALAVRMASWLFERGIYVIGFSYPVVPQGKARIRVQLSAAHSLEMADRAADLFIEARRELAD
jgi:glycine C-acetyltransferase